LIAAPLKRAILRAIGGTYVQFPRSFDRGPIEASELWRSTFTSGKFPRSFDRGPIEARKTARHIPGTRHFRDHLIAAPLKRLGSDPEVQAAVISAII